MHWYNNTIAGIVALRNEKGSYNTWLLMGIPFYIVALRNEKGSYNGWCGAFQTA